MNVFPYLRATSRSGRPGPSLPPFGIPGKNQERTLILIKPDGVERGLVGEVREQTRYFIFENLWARVCVSIYHRQITQQDHIHSSELSLPA